MVTFVFCDICTGAKCSWCDEPSREIYHEMEDNATYTTDGSVCADCLRGKGLLW
jgi:hypothetical protein